MWADWKCTVRLGPGDSAADTVSVLAFSSGSGFWGTGEYDTYCSFHPIDHFPGLSSGIDPEVFDFWIVTSWF